MDTWGVPPQVVDEIPVRRARLMRAVKDALQEGRRRAEERERRRAEQQRRPRRR